MTRTVVALGLAVGSTARAAPPEDVHLDLVAGTTFPVDVGGRLQLELPHRLRLGFAGGWLPHAYIDVVNEIALAAGWYDDDTGRLVSEGLADAAVFGVDLGWRPIPRKGLILGAGYQLVALGGGLVPTDLVSAAVPLGGLGRSAGSADLSSLLHTVTVHLGYEQVWLDHLVLRVAVGGMFTVWSSTDIEGSGGLLGASDATWTRAEEYLDQTYRSYVHTPSLAVQLGYRFF